MRAKSTAVQLTLYPPAAACVHCSNNLAATNVPLKGPIIHEVLVKRRYCGGVVSMEGPGRTPDHGLGARELSDLLQGANPLALRAVAAIKQVPATHEDAEVVEPS
jgi:hypothetical protein